MAARESADWSREEVQATVADYLQMLVLELAGQSYNKTEHRRKLLAALVGRSESSIEFKHGNISAVLIELGFPYIRGYQPRRNYQNLLVDVVAERVQRFSLLDQAALAAVQQPAASPAHPDFSKLTVDAPARQHQASIRLAPVFHAAKRDYLERESRNRSLGAAGEEFAIKYEDWRLRANGQPHLADRIEHVSRTRGDGLGFDILSFNLDGSERYIEVKTTTFGRETPFFCTESELARSRQEGESFHLYRLFEFRREPRIFQLAGALDVNCFLDPHTYRAHFG